MPQKNKIPILQLMYVARYFFFVYCGVWIVGSMQSTALAQKLMWTETYRAGAYSTDAQIRTKIKSPSRASSRSPQISISATTFGEYYEFFRENKANVTSLRVLGAGNDEIEKLSTLDSLLCLALPVCRARDFRSLTRLDKLQDLRISNPSLRQFREEELLAQMESLRRLTLYNVADVQAAIKLPGLDPPLSPAERGLFRLAVHAREWNPAKGIEWPDELERLREFSVSCERFGVLYVANQREASLALHRQKTDAPAICSTVLRDLIERSGFFNHRRVTTVFLTSRYLMKKKPYAAEYDPTDISPLKAFSDLRYLILTGDFYGFEHLKSVPLESIDFTEKSPFPSQQAVEAMSNHPTLKRVTKTIESATEEVLWQRDE